MMCCLLRLFANFPRVGLALTVSGQLEPECFAWISIKYLLSTAAKVLAAICQEFIMPNTDPLRS